MNGRLRVIASVLRDPALRRVEAAYLIFNMSENATWIAILVFAYARGGAAAAATISVIQLIPSAIVAPLAAYAGDRFRRERVLLAAYVVQSAAMGTTSVALLLDAGVSIVYLTAALTATSVTFTRPAQAALTPALATTPEALTAANATSGVVEGVGVMLGPMIAGIVLGLAGPGIVFAVFAALTGIGALLVVHLPVDVDATTPSPDLDTSTVWRETLGGFTALRRSRDARTLVLMLASGVLVVGALDVLFIAAAIELLDMGQSGVGYLNAAFGAGGIVGAAAAVALVGRRRLTPPIARGAGVFGGPVGAVAIAPSALGAPVLFAIAGAGRSIADIAGRTLLQRVAPNEVLTRVFGVLEGLAMVALALGSAGAGALVEAFGERTALLVAGAFVPLVVVLLSRRLLAIDRVGVAPDAETLDLLRSLEVFAPLPPTALERVIRNLEPMMVARDAVVIRQGDVGDRFYVIAEGTAAVVVDGRTVSTLGAGDGFGEIALLRDVPRTATVTATTPIRLFALARDPFLEAVTGHPQSHVAAHALIDRRNEENDAARR
jgi:MFS family permease